MRLAYLLLREAAGVHLSGGPVHPAAGRRLGPLLRGAPGAGLDGDGVAAGFGGGGLCEGKADRRYDRPRPQAGGGPLDHHGGASGGTSELRKAAISFLSICIAF